MDKDAFKKIMKLSAKTLFTYYTNLLPNVFTDFFFAGGVRAQFVELRESRESKFTDIPFRYVFRLKAEPVCGPIVFTYVLIVPSCCQVAYIHVSKTRTSAFLKF